MLVLIVIIGQVEAHLLHPIVMSRAVNLHPLAVALSVATGTLLAGVIGAVVAVPMVAVAWTVRTAMKAPQWMWTSPQMALHRVCPSHQW